jgi:hypothetical protein
MMIDRKGCLIIAGGLLALGFIAFAVVRLIGSWL